MSIIETNICPRCNSDLRSSPIPEEHKDSYPEGQTHFSRVIGVEYAYDNPNHYDGVSEWVCPDCKYREGRWTGRELAEGELEPRFGETP